MHTRDHDGGEGGRQSGGGDLKSGEPPVAEMLKEYKRYRDAAEGIERLKMARERRFGCGRHGACLLQERFPSRPLDATLVSDF
jgi:hypothetical protein